MFTVLGTAIVTAVTEFWNLCNCTSFLIDQCICHVIINVCKCYFVHPSNTKLQGSYHSPSTQLFITFYYTETQLHVSTTNWSSSGH